MFKTSQTNNKTVHRRSLIGQGATLGLSALCLPWKLTGQEPKRLVDTDIAKAMKYAFGLNLTAPSDPGNLPPVTRSGPTLTANLNEPANISGITYRMQSSPDLSAGSWTNIADLGDGTGHRFSVTGGSKLFVRYQIEVI
jgi:hypothetical protein